MSHISDNMWMNTYLLRLIFPCSSDTSRAAWAHMSHFSVHMWMNIYLLKLIFPCSSARSTAWTHTHSSATSNFSVHVWVNTYLLKLIFVSMLIGHVQFFSLHVNEHLLVEVDFSVFTGHVQFFSPRVNEHLLVEVDFSMFISHVKFFSPRVNEHLLVEADFFPVLLGHVQFFSPGTCEWTLTCWSWFFHVHQPRRFSVIVWINTYLLKLIFFYPCSSATSNFSVRARVNEHLLVEVDFSMFIGHVQFFSPGHQWTLTC